MLDTFAGLTINTWAIIVAVVAGIIAGVISAVFASPTLMAKLESNRSKREENEMDEVTDS